MNLHRVVLRCSLLSLSVLALHPFYASAQVRPRVTGVVDNAQRVTLRGNVHPLARAEFDRGAVSDAQAINRILLLLKRSDEQEAALETMLENQQDKSSPSYHQWLTPEQFGAQFGPADADIQAVTAWLTAQGFSINRVYSGKTVIEFSGSAGQVRQAFGTAIHHYEVNGKTYSANTSDPLIPAVLAPVVAGVVSLHNFPRQFYARHTGAVRRSGGKSQFEPIDPQVTNTYEETFELGPGDFAKIYGTPGMCGTPAAVCNGAGQTIAVVGETNFNVSDVQQFRSIFGLPATFDANSIVYNGEDPGITSTDEEGEALLDAQWSGGVAPGATIKYVLSASTSASQGVDLSALYIVEHNLAGAMSESYGACEADLGSVENAFVNNLWEQASAQGITVSVSTGDSGSAGCDDPHTEQLATHGPAVNGLASTPYNVAVGGTDFDEFGKWNNYWNTTTNNSVTGSSALGYIPEIPWNQSCAQLGATGCNINTTPAYLQNIVAGGGGASTLYNRPSWQMGVSGAPSSDGKRDLPDVSLFASPGFNGTGYLYCQSDASAACNVTPGFAGPNLYFGVVGGTSASAPSFAGIMALVNQSQATTQNPAPRQGNASYILYALANKSGASCASKTPVTTGCIFNDLVGGSSALPQGGTGIGTIDVPCGTGTLDCNGTGATQVGVIESGPGSTTMAWNVSSGYDMASGLGSVNIGNLIAAWGNASTVPTTTTLALSPTTGLNHGSTASNVTINVSAKSGTATGTVSLIALVLAQPSGTTPFSVGAFALDSSGKATGTTRNLPGGTNYQVYAHYSGDGVNAPSDSVPVSVTVAQESSKTFIVVPSFDPNTGNLLNPNATTVAYGSPYIVRVYVTNSGGTGSPEGAPAGACSQSSSVACPSGTIALTENGNPVDGGTFHLNDIGYTRDIAPTLPGGTYPLAAAYSGDSSYQSSNASETFTVTPSPTTLNPPTTNGNSSLVGQPVFISVMLNTQAFTGVLPTGTFTFYDGTTALGSPVTIVSSNPPGGSTPAFVVAQTSPTFTTTGNHTFTAKYSGDANYAAANSSGNATVDVVYQTSMTLSSSSTSINFGQSITLTAVITGLGKSPAISGQPQFQFTGPGAPFTNATSTPGTDANGNQMLTVTATTVPQGSGSYFATYPGDTNYEYANSAGVFVNVITPDFSLGPQGGISVVPTAGQSGSAAITITPVTQTASLVILQLPAGTSLPGYTIALNPTQVNLNGAAATATLALTPNGSGGATAMRAQMRKAGLLSVDHGGTKWTQGPALFLLLLSLLGIPYRRRKLRSALGLSAVCLFYFLGCGGGGGGGSQQKPTSIALTTSNAKVPQTGTYTVTATVTGSGALTGTVAFYDYSNLLESGVPLVNGGATMGSGNLASMGVHQITAKYSGDANDLPSSSAPLTQTITGTTSISIQGYTGQDIHYVQATIGLQ